MRELGLGITNRPRKYWDNLKKKFINERYFEVSEKIGQLKLPAPDGKMREGDRISGTCRNKERECFIS